MCCSICSLAFLNNTFSIHCFCRFPPSILIPASRRVLPGACRYSSQKSSFLHCSRSPTCTGSERQRGRRSGFCVAFTLWQIFIQVRLDPGETEMSASPAHPPPPLRLLSTVGKGIGRLFWQRLELQNRSLPTRGNRCSPSPG